jgi:hypothetical protein
MNSPVVSWVRDLVIPEDRYSRQLVELPKLQRTELPTEQEIAEYLYDKGVATQSIENLLRELNELKRIAKWYIKSGIKPSESETIAYLIAPLFRALGWTPQKMAIEWNNVDLALFNQLPREDGNLSVVVEAKRRQNSCLSAISQAEYYAAGRSNCSRLVITEGIRYAIFVKRETAFVLHAYMDLTEFRDEYPVYECHGIEEALRAMTPEWVG